MQLKYIVVLGALALGGCGKDISYYKKELCQEKQDCAVVTSGDFAYRMTTKGDKIIKAEEYSREDLETKLRDVPITQTSTSIRKLKKT